MGRRIYSRFLKAILSNTSRGLNYYERSVPLEAVVHIYQHKELTEALIRSLNPERDLEVLAGEVAEIGYPAVREPKL